jgi:hypothetical protein
MRTFRKSRIVLKICMQEYAQGYVLIYMYTHTNKYAHINAY